MSKYSNFRFFDRNQRLSKYLTFSFEKAIIPLKKWPFHDSAWQGIVQYRAIISLFNWNNCSVKKENEFAT